MSTFNNTAFYRLYWLLLSCKYLVMHIEHSFLLFFINWRSFSFLSKLSKVRRYSCHIRHVICGIFWWKWKLSIIDVKLSNFGMCSTHMQPLEIPSYLPLTLSIKWANKVTREGLLIIPPLERWLCWYLKLWHEFAALYKGKHQSFHSDIGKDGLSLVAYHKLGKVASNLKV